MRAKAVPTILSGMIWSIAVPAAPVPLAGAGALPRPAVILFWATWCVPCRQELDRAPRLAIAARPLPLVVLALDPPDIARAALATRSVDLPIFTDARAPAAVLSEWGGGSAGLPLAVAIDAAGRTCGVRRGLLGTDQLHRWARTCSR